jgi:hypothetical protein
MTKQYIKEINVEDYVELGVAGTATHAEGRAYYDPNEHALVVFNDETSLSQKLGQDFFIRVYNNSGAAILAGKPVYLSGLEATENRPTIGLARADISNFASVIGLTTHTIADSSFGYITKSGIISNIDTSSFAVGNPLFLDETTAGNLRNSEPGDGNISVFIGYVLKSDPTLGKILITSAGSESKPVQSSESYAAMEFFNDVTPDPYELSTGVYTKITSFNVAKTSGTSYVDSDVITNNRLTIGSLGAGEYIASYQITGIATGGGDLRLALYKNGLIQDPSILEYTVTNNNKFSMSGAEGFTLNENDYIEIYMTADTNTADPEVIAANVHLTRISGGQKGADGAPGPAGADGDVTWEGTWVSQNYLANQAVEYQGSSYVCKLNTIANEVPTNTTYWDLMASKGGNRAS